MNVLPEASENHSANDTLTEPEIHSLRPLCQGKVRSVYIVDDERLLIVASDRLSAFDVVLPDPIPDKGRVLNAMSRFWFERTARIVPNHVLPIPPQEVLADDEATTSLLSRSVVVVRTRPLPVEAIVRGYLAGSGWRDYRRTGAICGQALPPGLARSARLPEILFTPSTKAEGGRHDVNISFERCAGLIGRDLARKVRDSSIRLYQEGARHALDRGIIIADTKFEFGLASEGQLLLIDELLTPDSSRFWPVEEWREGASPPSFDKQFVRDHLESIHWNKTPPAPRLPSKIIARTAEKYQRAYALITQPARPGAV